VNDLMRASRALLDELNAHAAAGLITRQALILMNRLQQVLSTLEREAARG